MDEKEKKNIRGLLDHFLPVSACFETGHFMSGNSISTRETLNIWLCQSLCYPDPGCFHFSYSDLTHECKFFSSSSQKTPDPALTNSYVGPWECPDTCEEKNQSSASVCVHNFCLCSSSPQNIISLFLSDQ
jgi:hypothetical protein